MLLAAASFWILINEILPYLVENEVYFVFAYFNAALSGRVALPGDENLKRALYSPIDFSALRALDKEVTGWIPSRANLGN